MPIFIDHLNSLFTFNLAAMDRSLGHHKVLKFILWDLFLSPLNNHIGHVLGDTNNRPDMSMWFMRVYRKAYFLISVTASVPFSGVTDLPESPEL